MMTIVYPIPALPKGEGFRNGLAEFQEGTD